MAEFLIFNREHWMDKLTPEEVSERTKTDEHFKEKYDARYQKGDIVEVQEDGFWSKNKVLPNESKWKLVKIPGMSKEDAKQYMESELQDDGRKIVLKRKYKIKDVKVKKNGDVVSITDIENKIENKKEKE
jgi:hypothetical protein